MGKDAANSVEEDIRRRRWSWLGHTLRKPPSSIGGLSVTSHLGSLSVQKVCTFCHCPLVSAFDKGPIVITLY